MILFLRIYGLHYPIKSKKETADHRNDLLFLVVEMRGIEPLTS